MALMLVRTRTEWGTDQSMAIGWTSTACMTMLRHIQTTSSHTVLLCAQLCEGCMADVMSHSAGQGSVNDWCDGKAARVYTTTV